MYRRWSKLLLLTLSILLALGTTACGDDEAAEADLPTGSIEGTVSLEGSDSAEGVDVKLLETNKTQQTEGDGAFSFGGIETGPYQIEFSKQGYQTATKEVEVTDGATATVEVTLEQVNESPSLNGISASPPTLRPGAKATVSANASDPNGDELTYEWNAPSGWSIDDPSTSSIEVTAPDEYGASVVLELTVSDPDGASVSGSIALSTVENDGPIISSVTAAPQTAQRGGTISLDVSANDPNGDELEYKWSAPSGWSFDDDSIKQPKLTAPDMPGATANIEVTVTDAEGLSATGSVVVSTAANQAPVVSSLTADNTTLSRQGSTDVLVSATDPNGDPLTYSWSLSNSDWSRSGMGDTITVTAPDSPSSSTRVTVTVEDDAGGSTTANLTISTGPNEGPEISALFAKQNPLARGGTTDVQVDATDPNGDALSYSWSRDNSNWNISGSGETVSLSAPNTPTSTVLVTVTVTDSLGASSSSTVQVSTVSNNAPQITTVPSTGDQNAGRSTFTYQAEADDPDDSNLTWNLSTNPTSSAQIDNNTGKLTWTVPRSAAGQSYTFTVSVSDGNDTVTQKFTLDITAFDIPSEGPFEVGQQFITPDGLVPAVADFDGDGLADVALEYGGQELSFVLSSQGLQNEEVEQWSGPPSPNFDECRINGTGDLDGDNDTDVIAACDEDDSNNNDITLATWLNDIDQSQQTGTFSIGSVVNSGVSADVVDLGVAEIDGNAGVDMVVADDAQTLHVVTNGGSGGLTFSQSVSPSPPMAATGVYDFLRIEVDDFDGDSSPEVLALEEYNDGSTDQSQLALYDFDGSGTLQPTRTSVFGLTDNPDKMATGDLDGDNDLDVAVKTAGATVSVTTILNDGSGNFSSGDTIAGTGLTNFPSNRGVAIGNVDNDGNADVVVSDGSTGTVHVAFGDGSGNLTDIVELGPTGIGSDEFEEVFVVDSDGDGLNDIFGWDFGRMVVYR